MSPELEGVLAGVALSGLNTAAGVAIAKRSAKMPLKNAMSLVIGGMMVRLAIMVVLMWICFAVLDFHRTYFTLSLMISFFVLLMVETFFFHAKAKGSEKPIIRRKRRSGNDTTDGGK